MNILKQLFSQPETPGNVPEYMTVAPAPKSGEVITAERIQRDLTDTADAVVAEARAILAAAEAPDPRALRLIKMGFSSTPEAEKYRELEAKISEQKRVSDMYEKYAQKYPGLKFIDDNTMKAICEKYGLLVGGLDRYTGHVPDWALDRMEVCGIGATIWHIQSREKKDRGGMSMGWSLNNGRRDRVPNLEGGLWSYDEAKEKAAKLAKENQKHDFWVYGEQVLRIAAPAKEMIHRKQELQGHMIVPVQDPIVSLRVEGGYCVICAWGEEGQDPRVFNAENN